MAGESNGRPKPVPVITPALRRLLWAVLALFALLTVNAVYLGAVTFIEWLSGQTIQDYFYQYMFLAHLVLGLVVVVPVVVYGVAHMRRARSRPNRRAVKVGYALFAVALLLLATGLVLTRGLPWIEIRHPDAREVAYWLHVVTPFVVAWLFVLHRLAGRRINWRFGAAVAGVAGVFAAAVIVVQAQDPRRWNQAGPEEGEQYFFPSLARTSTGGFIPAESLMRDEYCAECHADAHAGWEHSAHRLSSFNNPAYLFSVRETRAMALERDGNVRAARFCAGCHDPVPFFSGAFDDPEFDDVNHPTSQAGITCSSCHAITNINSPRGNSDYTIEEPLQYPFAYTDQPALAWINRTLVKAKPDFHKRTYLKSFHSEPEFCGTCHKVHLPEELNGYRWLRGQNHYDSFLLSGVSGHGVASFYYPPAAKESCSACHMAPQLSDDFGARDLDGSGMLQIHGHAFPAANTGVPHMLGLPESVNEGHRAMLEGSLRVDIFGVKEAGRIDGRLHAPLRPSVPTLQPGGDYLLETVLRTLTLGHHFTQGTADSNQVWVDVTLSSGGRVVGRSGGMEPGQNRVDPWSHFVNAYVLDREGRRIDRRNAADIFTALYNHQIPPGAADVVHYAFTVPEDLSGELTVEVSLRYRKFDTTYMQYIFGNDFEANDLPIVTIASDRVTFPVGESAALPQAPPAIAEWERWNDYGIGLLRKPRSGELRQAEEAFRQVEALGSAHGPVNLARVYLREGRLDDATAALGRAAVFDPAPYPWTVAWLTAQVNAQNGYLDEAIETYRALVDTRFPEARARGFDFSRDYRLLNRLAGTLFERAKVERGDARRAARDAFLAEAEAQYSQALELDPENVTAHYGLAQIHTLLGRAEDAARHRALHAKYKVDDNARDRAIAAARRADPAADHAAAAVTIYDLQRPGAYGLPPASLRTSSR